MTSAEPSPSCQKLTKLRQTNDIASCTATKNGAFGPKRPDFFTNTDPEAHVAAASKIEIRPMGLIVDESAVVGDAIRAAPPKPKRSPMRPPEVGDSARNALAKMTIKKGIVFTKTEAKLADTYWRPKVKQMLETVVR